MKKQKLGLIFFGVFWTAIVLVFDGSLGSSLVNQLRAHTFAHVTGYITHSEVTSHDSDDGVTHGVDIRYHYEVGGQSFEGNRYRYGAGSSSDSGWAHNAVNRYHQGAEVTVYYNPRNPSESLLAPGVDSSNLMMLLFMTPFNAVMLGFWMAGLSLLRAKFSTSPNGGVKFSEQGQFLRIRLPRYPAYLSFLATTGLVGFLAIFPIAFLGGGFHPRMNIVCTALVLAYGSGLAMYLWQTWKNHSGKSDLVIDAARQTVTLPRTFSRKAVIEIALSDLRELKVQTEAHQGSEGGTTYSYITTLSWKNGDPAQGKLAEWYNENKAQTFVDWLLPQLKINSANSKTTSWKGSMSVPERAPDIS